MHRNKQLEELCVFVGRLFHAANHPVLPDGSVARDSEALRPKAKPRKARRTRTVKAVAKPSAASSPVQVVKAPAEWASAWSGSSTTKPSEHRGRSQATRQTCAG